jgi:hypothetical protein
MVVVMPPTLDDNLGLPESEEISPLRSSSRSFELSPNFGDGGAGQAAAVMG